ALRAAAVHDDGAVLLDGGEVAGEQPAGAVLGGDEGAGGLVGVVVVAERDVAGLGDGAEVAGAGPDGVQPLVEDDEPGVRVGGVAQAGLGAGAVDAVGGVAGRGGGMGRGACRGVWAT